MKYYFLNTGTDNGQYNMDFDIHIARVCKPGEFYFRLYRWNPYCISLGANQKYESINFKTAEENNIDIVKRPTGGRAILHSEELTYSVVTSTQDQKSARNFYNEINKALKTGLILYNDKLKDIELESVQPDFREIYKESSGNVCFAATAKSEIKYRGKKLVGSAQRKFGSNLLQHGSILCGGYHKNLIRYLNLTLEEKKTVYNRINNSTIDLYSIINEDTNYIELENSLKNGFINYFGSSFTDVTQTIIKEQSKEVFQVF